MQITANTTAMQTDCCVQTDKLGRDHCVVVIKGTFTTDEIGDLRLAGVQRPLTYVDKYYGDPGVSPVIYECDLMLVKPMTEVIVVGKAVAPGRQPVTELPVRLEVDGRSKDILVIGERRWVRSVLGMVASPPLPFIEMPLTFDRAFGGMDDSSGPQRVACEPRNLAGVGFHANRNNAQIDGTALPNLEDPRDRVHSPRSRPSPRGFGVVGRNWQPRARFAGTYDDRWREDKCPFLPDDFDERFFQCAPADQQFPRFKGGELIRCVHMASDPVVQYRVPSQKVPVYFHFVQGEIERVAELDTIILQPHDREVQLVWRASAPLTKKLVDLRRIEIGEKRTGSQAGAIGYRRGKPVFPGVEATIRWLNQRRGRS